MLYNRLFSCRSHTLNTLEPEPKIRYSMSYGTSERGYPRDMGKYWPKYRKETVGEGNKSRWGGQGSLYLKVLTRFVCTQLTQIYVPLSCPILANQNTVGFFLRLRLTSNLACICFESLILWEPICEMKRAISYHQLLYKQIIVIQKWQFGEILWTPEVVPPSYTEASSQATRSITLYKYTLPTMHCSSTEQAHNDQLHTNNIEVQALNNTVLERLSKDKPH